MESNLINISLLNDFVFCPYSIYLHNVYNAVEQEQYHEEVQVRGKNAHETIDTASYNTRKTVLLGMAVYSEKYNLAGKIDLFDVTAKKLTERKRQIKTLYDGYILQLYAQYFCLVEMGYEVKIIGFYSLADNRPFPIAIPNCEKTAWFESWLDRINAYHPEDELPNMNIEKCRYCIYHSLCDKTPLIRE